jgi:hypothetical protein
MLAKQCAPQALAGLVAIAGDPRIQAGDRCAAMEAIVGRAHIEPGRYNAEYVRRRSVLLDTPREREALKHLLDDVTPWCRIGPRASGDTGAVIAGRDVAFRVIGDFPVEGMRVDIEALRDSGTDETPGRLRPANVLAAYDWNARHAPAADAAKIDAIVADATPRSFEELIELAATTPPANAEVSQHIDGALAWLRTLAALSDKDQRDCVVASRPALTSGSLGKLMIEKFDRLTPSQRALVLEIFVFAAPGGAKDWATGVLARDPDEKVRSAADTLVEALARRQAGSATP